MARKWFQLVGEDGNAVTSADAVVVDIEDVAAFRKAVKEEFRDSHLAGIAASDLTVFDANGVALDPQDSLAHIDENVTLIVQVPRRAEVAPTSKVQQETLLKSLEWGSPKRLCASTGQDWPYQGAAELSAILADPLAQHYNAWKVGNQDKQTHALFLVLSGPGTGKSRMLDEMKGLLCKAAKQSGDCGMVSRMKKAYEFHVTFENGTSATGKLLVSESPEFDVSYRMLYQLARDREPWMAFVDRLLKSYSTLPLRIEDVIDILATLEKIENVEDMTVILCLDGLQKLAFDETKGCDFYRVMAIVCQFLNSSRAFVVCLCSATVQKPISRALAGSTQKRVFLLPPPLHGHEIIATNSRLEKQLVDDMGGHGRALEALQQVMHRHHSRSLEEVDPATVVDEVYVALKSQYGEIFDSGWFAKSSNCQEVLAAVLSRRTYGVLQPIGSTSVTVDELRSFGLFRWTPEERVECAFILLLMLMKRIPNKVGEVASFDEHITRSVLVWQRIETFVAFYRRVKSIAFCKIPVLLSDFHAGARFSAIDGVWIEEQHPRAVVEAINQNDTKYVSEDSSCFFTSRDVDVKLSEMNTIVMNAASASTGDLFMRVQFLEGNELVQCNEVIQCKLIQTKQKMNKATYEKEQAKAVKGDSDVFLLITSAEVSDDFALPPRCGIVSKDEFLEYFGPFASRAYRSLLEPPNINTASFRELRLIEGVGDAMAKAIIRERKRGRLLSHEDAVSRLELNKKPKTAGVLKPFLYNGRC